MIVLPSAKSTVRASRLTVTLRAATSLVSMPEIFTPPSQQQSRPLVDEGLYATKLCSAEAVVPFQSHGIDPKLGLKVVRLHMHMRRLVPVRRIEKNRYGPGLRYRRKRIQCTFLTNELPAAECQLSVR